MWDWVFGCGAGVDEGLVGRRRMHSLLFCHEFWFWCWSRLAFVWDDGGCDGWAGVSVSAGDETVIGDSGCCVFLLLLLFLSVVLASSFGFVSTIAAVKLDYHHSHHRLHGTEHTYLPPPRTRLLHPRFGKRQLPSRGKNPLESLRIMTWRSRRRTRYGTRTASCQGVWF